jgi:hypothetical protein
VGEKIVEIKDKKKFIEQCENIMNTSEIFDRRLYKDEFKKIYNKFKYNFGINNNFLSNIITNWKLKTNRFKKCSVLDHPKDYNNRLILREFRTLYFNVKNKKEPQKIEYIIWGNEENIRRLRISNHLFIDSTFHHPPEFKQLMIIMYHDIVSNLNIPGIYILMNGKSQIHYDIIFDSIINIITNYHELDLNINSIVTDSEVALVKSVKKYFPNSLRISCLFHYKQDLMRNIREYGLYKKPDKKLSDKIIYKLSILTIKYKGDMNYVKQKLENIITKYTKYQNFINNYFIKEKLKYFEDNSLNYDLVPEKFRTNNFLENYNLFIKTKLCEKRIILSTFVEAGFAPHHPAGQGIGFSRIKGFGCAPRPVDGAPCRQKGGDYETNALLAAVVCRAGAGERLWAGAAAGHGHPHRRALRHPDGAGDRHGALREERRPAHGAGQRHQGDDPAADRGGSGGGEDPTG